MQHAVLPAIAALALAACATSATAQPAWTLGAEGTRTALAYGTGTAEPVIRFACEPAGAAVRVLTRPPRRPPAEGQTAATNLSLFIARTEVRVPSTLSRAASGQWQVDGPIPDLPRLITALRTNSRFAITTHAGRTTALSPSAELLDGFQKACAQLAR